MNDLTLLIPAKNEKESLPIVLDELKKYNIKILIVLSKNDHETINSIAGYDVEIFQQKTDGYGAALIDGINHISSKYLCIFNADGSFKPDELQEMYKKLKNNSFVFGTRYEDNCGSADDTLLTFFGNYIFTKIGKIFFKLKVTDILYTFVMGETNKFKTLRLEQQDFTICTEIPIKIKKFNFSYTNNKSFERARLKGKKKVSEFKDGLKILFYILKKFFS